MLSHFVNTLVNYFLSNWLHERGKRAVGTSLFLHPNSFTCIVIFETM